MGLNESKGNMYDWVTHTWNAVKGACPHDCDYCYMKRWGNLNPVRLDEKELRTNLGIGNFIFVGSSCDLFAEGIKHGWVADTLIHCSMYPDNRYLFQTKNPQLMYDFRQIIPKGSALCVTIETNRNYVQMGRTPTPMDRANWLGVLAESFDTYVTIEPVMDFDLEELVELVKQCRPKQVNIGADSGGNKLPEPDGEKLQELIYELGKFTTVKPKKNLKRLLPVIGYIEYPEDFRHEEQ